jgi:TamB, inner membrane protein subunit of TAM complex
VDSKPAQTDVKVNLSGVSVNLTGDTSADVQSLDDHPEISVEGEEKPIEEPKPEKQASIINVFVRSDESIWIRRDDFAVRMSTNLGVHVAHGTSEITGEVKLERGYIALLGQQFDVKAGRVTFTGSQNVNPSLELTAQSTSPSGKVVRVEVTGFVSAPQLAFFVNDQAVNAGEALLALTGHGDNGSQESAENQIASAAIGMTTGLLSLGARREFGDFIPMLSIDQGEDTRVRAGFEVDKLVPKFMRKFVRGAYVEGVVSTGGETSDNSSGNAQGGVLLELMLPSDLVWAGKYGPGQTWSVDLDWRP